MARRHHAGRHDGASDDGGGGGGRHPASVSPRGSRWGSRRTASRGRHPAPVPLRGSRRIGACCNECLSLKCKKLGGAEMHRKTGKPSREIAACVGENRGAVGVLPADTHNGPCAGWRQVHAAKVSAAQRRRRRRQGGRPGSCIPAGGSQICHLPGRRRAPAPREGAGSLGAHDGLAPTSAARLLADRPPGRAHKRPRRPGGPPAAAPPCFCAAAAGPGAQGGGGGGRRRGNLAPLR